MTAATGLIAAWASAGCRTRPAPAPADDDAAADNDSVSAPLSAAFAEERPVEGRGGGPSPGLSGKPRKPERDRNIRQISVSQLLALLKSRKDLKALTVNTAPHRFGGLVPAFADRTRNDERWELEGLNDSGLIRSIIVTFVPTAEDDGWVFRSVSVRLHSEEPDRTFQEIQRAANAALRRPKWLDLNARNRTAWSMGDGWELVAAVLDDGDVHLRAGRPEGH